MAVEWTAYVVDILVLARADAFTIGSTDGGHPRPDVELSGGLAATLNVIRLALCEVCIVKYGILTLTVTIIPNCVLHRTN